MFLLRFPIFCLLVSMFSFNSLNMFVIVALKSFLNPASGPTQSVYIDCFFPCVSLYFFPLPLHQCVVILWLKTLILDNIF